jgi:hypothetical protein
LGYVTPRGKLTGLDREIFGEQEHKLEAAREVVAACGSRLKKLCEHRRGRAIEDGLGEG